jgi:hypothetical protein
MRILLSLLVAVATAQTFASSDKLVIHEWGTFTSFQDETGRSIPGLNVDDEPLPPFVQTIPISNEQSSKFSKAIPRLHPQVTMRLETPVVYFYPPQDAKLPMDITFTATFNGGLLTQFFPRADVSELSRSAKNLVRIEPKSAGTLSWKNVKVGTRGTLEEATYPVWTAPREVQSATLTAGDGKSEKFLFYRGVGNLDAPLRVTRNGAELQIALAPEVEKKPELWPQAESLFLVQIRDDGKAAFRRFRAGCGERIRPDQKTAATFNEMDFTFDPHNLDRLRDSMRVSLVSAGLKTDEASAMLKTWEQSYFKSPGMRLFFIVPPAWTNAVLPITVSQPAEITRVMVGRIEIVTPPQREAIETIANAKDVKDKVLSATYQGLGRFRDALLLDAVKAKPQLEAFLKLKGIRFAETSDRPVVMLDPADQLSRGASPAAK